MTSSAVTGCNYKGSTSSPYGSSIIEISAAAANDHNTVHNKFEGSDSSQWTVVIWNKLSSDGLLDGWYGDAYKDFTLLPGGNRYIACAENSQGG